MANWRQKIQITEEYIKKNVKNSPACRHSIWKLSPHTSLVGPQGLDSSWQQCSPVDNVSFISGQSQRKTNKMLKQFQEINWNFTWMGTAPILTIQPSLCISSTHSEQENLNTSPYIRRQLRLTFKSVLSFLMK